MKTARKWSPAKKEYEHYILPEGACLFSQDMGEVISCASCGRKLEYGVCYTSKQIHTEMGFGYSVCDKCYDREWQSENQK